ncbi:MAG: 4Fe-4S binding protein [Planctomycetes bacterium]|nr:4Fe-4S binding protein [Planctomycetota bacterium]
MSPEVAKPPAPAAPKAPPRRKPPKQFAMIDENGCTGCEACVQFCPVDCIRLLPGTKDPNVNKICRINLDLCIGCELCVKPCPWETIYMLPFAEALELNESQAWQAEDHKEQTFADAFPVS